MSGTPALDFALVVAAVAVGGWLIVAAISLGARIVSGRRQAYGMPWWGLAGLGAAQVTATLGGAFSDGAGGDALTMGLFAVVLLFAGFLSGSSVRFSLLGQYPWWNPAAVVPERRASRRQTKDPAPLLAEASSAPALPPGPVDRSDYDGHADYVEEARKEASAGAVAAYVKDNLDVPHAAWKLLDALQTLVGFGVAATTGYLLMAWIRANVRGELGFGGIAILLGVFLVSVITGGLFVGLAAVITRYSPRWRTLIAINAAALLFIVFGMVVPLSR